MNKPLRFSLLTCGLATLLSAPPAYAGRPLQTEDAGVLERNECEIEGVRTKLRVSPVTLRDTSLGLNCGVGYRSQIGAGVSWTKVGAQRAGAVGLGGKTLLWSAPDDGPALTFAWSVAADRERHTYTHTSTDFALVGTLPFGPGAAHVNVGQVRIKSPKESANTWGLAYEFDGFDLGGLTWQPMAEVFGQQREDNWWNLGLRVAVVPKALFLDVSYGEQQTKSNKPKLLTAGFKFVF